MHITRHAVLLMSRLAPVFNNVVSRVIEKVPPKKDTSPETGIVCMKESSSNIFILPNNSYAPLDSRGEAWGERTSPTKCGKKYPLSNL